MSSLDPRENAPPRPADPGAVVAVEQDVYTFDIDFAGVVSNLVYMRWSEIWRLAWLGGAGLSIGALAAAGVVPFVVRQELNFRRPLRLGERVRLEGWLERIGESSVTLWLEMREAKGGELCCDNRQVIATADARTGKSTPIPAALRAKLGAVP